MPEMTPLRLFCSYAPEDQNFWVELSAHLGGLPKGLIEAWSADHLLPGENISQTLARQFEQAQVILLLISSDFISAGGRYHQEMQRAAERHRAGTACVIPIILRPVEWSHMPFGGLAPLPRDGKPISRFDDKDEAWLHVVKGIAQSVERWQKEQASVSHASIGPATASTPPTLPKTTPLRVLLQPPLVGVPVQALSADGTVVGLTESQLDGTASLAVPHEAHAVRARFHREVDRVRTRVDVTATLASVSASVDPVMVLALPYSLEFADHAQRSKQRTYDRRRWLRRHAPHLLAGSTVMVLLAMLAAMGARHLWHIESSSFYVAPLKYTPGLGLAGLTQGSRAYRILSILSSFAHREGYRQDVLFRLAFSNKPSPEPVPVKAFYLDEHEVTRREYQAFLRDKVPAKEREALTPREFADQLRGDPELADGQGFPVHSVTWEQANRFCQEYGGRLPHSSEWEIAARNLRPVGAGHETNSDGTTYPWGDNWFIGVTQTTETAEGHVARVCSHNDKNSQSICDLGGNLREWLADEGPRREGESTYHVRGSTYDSLGEVGSLGYIHYEPEIGKLTAEEMGFRCAYEKQPPTGRKAPQVTAGGSFRLGRPDDLLFEYLSRYGGVMEFLLEEPLEEAHVGEFFVQDHKVSVGEYRHFLRALGPSGHHASCREQNEPADYRHAVADKGADGDPVLGVSWYDAHAYCAFREQRLPTADEWERMVRGERGGLFPWGGPDRGDQALKKGLDEFLDPSTNEPNHLFIRGLFLHGPEWTNSPGWKPDTRILKGPSLDGAAKSHDPIHYVTTMRSPHPLQDKVAGAGFRCVLDRYPTLLEGWLGPSRRMRQQTLQWPHKPGIPPAGQ